MSATAKLQPLLSVFHRVYLLLMPYIWLNNGMLHRSLFAILAFAFAEHGVY